MSHHSISEINAMDEAQFVRTLGHIFEHSAWVVADSFDKKPFENVRALHRAMMEEVLTSPRDVQLKFLSAHPDLGGKEAREGMLTEDSAQEQKRAGLDSLRPEEFRHILELNSKYRLKHGFPFVACVKHYTKDGIFYEFERRVDKDTEEEFKTALEQISAITFLRLQALVGN